MICQPQQRYTLMPYPMIYGTCNQIWSSKGGFQQKIADFLALVNIKKKTLSFLSYNTRDAKRKFNAAIELVNLR